MSLSIKDYKVIRDWMYRNARPLDIARWQYHFEGGTRAAVLSVLEAYQNNDGGFGYALEPDSWNEKSSPIQTWTACEILHEVECPKDYPIVSGILSYLECCKEFNGSYWLAQVPSNNEYPHAPWWTYVDEEKAVWGYNPTAALLGFILSYGEKNSNIYNKALTMTQEAINKYILEDSFVMDMNELSCYIRLLQCIKKSGLEQEVKNVNEFAAKMRKNVKITIDCDSDKWGTCYCLMPSQYIQSSESIFYKENLETTNAELDFIIGSRNKEGVWDISWQWDKYEKEFVISENWWKAELVLKNMKMLKNFKRIE